MSTSSTETLTRPDGSPVRVLVVDDEQMLADLLASALRYEGWEVTTAGTGIAAVRIAREIEPDVVVLHGVLHLTRCGLGWGLVRGLLAERVGFEPTTLRF